MAHGRWQFSWNRGEAEMLQSGAMLGPVRFKLDGGRWVEPFAVAPWSDDVSPEHEALPPLLKKLRGEWVCVPFGMPEPPPNLPSGWTDGALRTKGFGPHFHGYSSNADWELEGLEGKQIRVSLDYPDGHPVQKVTRCVRGAEGRARLEFEMSVTTRAPVDLPMGLHPVFRLPDMPGGARLDFGGRPEVRTYPVDAEPGISRFAHDRHALPLQSIPCADGSMADLSRHPLPFETEELVLVSGHDGTATLTCQSDGYRVQLAWDRTAFPSCMLWISNRGRTAYPWNKRFQAIGIEPVIAPFDLGTDVAANQNNPISLSGVPTARPFQGGETWTTGYSIEVFPA